MTLNPLQPKIAAAAAPPPTYASAAQTLETARITRYASLRVDLTDPQHPTHKIRSQLSEPDLSIHDIHKLFGHIRKALLEILWRYRQLDLWIFRAHRMGIKYANAMDEEDGVAKYPARYAFYREMDEGLEMGGDGREEAVKFILKRVEVYREGLREVECRRATRAELLADDGT